MPFPVQQPQPTEDPYWSQFEPVAEQPALGPIDQVAQNAAQQSQPGPAIDQVTQFSQDITDPQAYFNSLFPGETLSPQQLMAAKDQLASRGIRVLTNASGVSAKIQLPNGQIIDVIQGAGAGVNRKQWLTGDGGAGGNNLASLGYNFGSSMAPWTEQFQAPTAEQAAQSPGVQFGLDEAMRRMQNSAAAKGTLLNGRVQQAIGASNVGNAMQQYGDVYNRALGEYGLRRENFYNNQDRPFDKNYRLASLGAPR